MTWCTVACCWCIFAVVAPAFGANLSAKAKEEGCTGRPTLVPGTGLYRCPTQGGMHYFNVPGAGGDADVASAARGTPSPSGFPRVDSTTQKGRDDIRRKVLNEELVTEEKLLAEARAAYAYGTPPPTPEEQITPEKYAARVDRLRQAVSLHEKNIEALKKELAARR